MSTQMEKEVHGHVYRFGRLDAMKQFHVTRRLAGLLAGLSGTLPQAATGGQPDPERLGMAALGPLADALAKMDDDAAEFVIHTCLGAVTRKQGKDGGWARVSVDGSLMFQDIGMPAMLTLVWHVLQGFLPDFFGALPRDLLAGVRT